MTSPASNQISDLKIVIQAQPGVNTFGHSCERA